MLKFLGAILKFFSRVLGPRFDVWAGLTLLTLMAFGVALVSGIFTNHGMDRAGPFTLVTGFSIATFLLLVPFGYLVEHFKSAISLRFVGWIYFLYVASVVCFIGYGIWLRVTRYSSGAEDALDAAGRLYASMVFFSMYTWISIPLAVVLVIFRKREPTTE